MAKHVILVLEYDMGDYSDYEKEVWVLSTDPKDWHNSFNQSNAFTDMNSWS